MTATTVSAPSTSTDAAARLRLVLTANATTSGAAGLVGLLATSWCVDELGLASVGWTRLVSAGLVAFALQVLVTSRLRARDRLAAGTLAITIADASWVALTAVAVVALDLTTLGVVVAVVQGVAVADFALLQHWFRRRL